MNSKTYISLITLCEWSLLTLVVGMIYIGSFASNLKKSTVFKKHMYEHYKVLH